MSKSIRNWCITVALFLGIFMRIPVVAQPATPQDVVASLIDAQNRQDLASMRALVAPDAQFILDTGSIASAPAGFDQYFQVPLPTVVVTQNEAVNENTVKVTAAATGGSLPALPNPYSYTALYTVQDGKITRVELTLSDQTRADLAAQQTPDATATPPEVQPTVPLTATDTTTAPVTTTDTTAAPITTTDTVTPPAGEQSPTTGTNTGYPTSPAQPTPDAQPQLPVTGRSSTTLPLACVALVLLLSGFVVRRRIADV